MRIITDLSQSRWEEYKNLRIQALNDMPQAFLDDLEQVNKLEAQDWQRKIKNMIFAEEKEILIGMIGFYQEDKEKLKHIVNIVSFYVIPTFRGKGAGKALLQTVIAKYSGNHDIKKLQLGVTDTQKPAQHLYKSLGFTQVGELKYAIKVGSEYFNEYLMEKYLS